MTYRVRKQALTGKLILQHDMTGPWIDAIAMPGEYAMVPVAVFHDMVAERAVQAERIAKYERRAQAQRTRRKAPAAQAASAQESEPC